MTLQKLHGLSALLIAAFVCVHIANHLAGLAGAATHIAFMEAARSVYRLGVIEWVLLGCVAFQIVGGLTLFVRDWKRRQGFIAWLQAVCGMLLALFLIVHVGAVLFGRGALNLDTNFYFAAAGFHVPPFQYFFAPYYFLGVAALFTHAACAAYWRSRNLPRVARILIVAMPSAIGVTLSMLIVLSLAGALFPVEIPAEYKATYAPVKR
jgi:succinate dehydrogenase/fumarate reductase cytochrome b subunit